MTSALTQMETCFKNYCKYKDMLIRPAAGNKLFHKFMENLYPYILMSIIRVTVLGFFPIVAKCKILILSLIK